MTIQDIIVILVGYLVCAFVVSCCVLQVERINRKNQAQSGKNILPLMSVDIDVAASIGLFPIYFIWESFRWLLSLLTGVKG